MRLRRRRSPRDLRRRGECAGAHWEEEMPRSRVEVLLLSGSESAASSLVKFLEERGCRCSVVSPARALDSPELFSFDLILSAMPLKQNDPLVLNLAEARCRVFYQLAVEDGCWWVPLGGAHEKHLGAPAVPCRNFAAFLEGVLREIESESASSGRQSRAGVSEREAESPGGSAPETARENRASHSSEGGADTDSASLDLGSAGEVRHDSEYCARR